MRWIGSIAVHAVLGVALVALVSHHAPPRPAPAATSLELVEVDTSMARQIDVPRPVQAAAPAGATTAAGGAAPAAKRAARGRGRVAIQEDPRGAITFDTGDTGDGTGTGRGAGTGGGIGFGEGAAIVQPADDLAPPPPPPPPKVSKARPPRLIFPSRQREVEDAQLFVMKVTVDRDGYVSGARLVRGFGGRRDEVAQDQIWRFRYEPALDDDGDPIVATVEQRFLIP